MISPRNLPMLLPVNLRNSERNVPPMGLFFFFTKIGSLVKLFINMGVSENYLPTKMIFVN